MNYNEVKELMSLFEESDLREMDLSMDNVSVRFSRNTGAAVPAAPVAVPMAGNACGMPAASGVPESSVGQEKESGEDSGQNEGSAQPEGVYVKSPIVGTFYASSAPDKPPYVKAGDHVAQGDVLCIIEAMKFMNEVPSDVEGTVAEVLVQDGEFVEYGQNLFRVV